MSVVTEPHALVFRPDRIRVLWMTMSIVVFLTALLVPRDVVNAGILIGRKHFRLKTPSDRQVFMIKTHEVQDSGRSCYGIIGTWNADRFVTADSLLVHGSAEIGRASHHRQAAASRFLNALEQKDWIGLTLQ